MAASPGNRTILDRFVLSMRGMALVYFILGLAVFFFSNQILYLMNFFPQVFHFLEPIETSSNLFWIAPTSAYLLTLAGLCLATSLYPNHRGYLYIHLFSKFVAVAAFSFLLFVKQKAFAHFLGLCAETFAAGFLLWTLLRLAFSRPVIPQTETAAMAPTQPVPTPSSVQAEAQTETEIDPVAEGSLPEPEDHEPQTLTDTKIDLAEINDEPSIEIKNES